MVEIATKYFAALPTLHTARLILRPLASTDILALYTLRTNATVNKFLQRKADHSLEQTEKFLARIYQNQRLHMSLYWGIQLQENSNVIGTIGLWDFRARQKSAELGFEILPQFQGQKLMKESVAAILDLAFYTLELQEIRAASLPRNASSVGLLRSFGFVPTCINMGLQEFGLSNKKIPSQKTEDF